MGEKLFTLQEANALLPHLELLMDRLQGEGMRLREHLESAARATGRAPESFGVVELARVRPETRPVLEAMRRLVGDLEACGGQFKGLDLGLVDFPAVIDGERVLLCWQYGEKEIAYYHTPEAGFAGRKALPSVVRRNTHWQ